MKHEQKVWTLIAILTIIGFTAGIFAACVSTKPQENPNAGPGLSVVIPEIFSPSPDIENDKMTIAININHPVDIKDWNIVIQPVRQGSAQRQTAAAGEPAAPRQTAAAQTGEQAAQGERRQRAPFFEQSGTGNPPAQWQWDGKSTRPSGEMVQSATDYRFVLTVNDIFDNNAEFEGVISVDVLVRREGDNLRIIVPSIIFPGDSSDLTRVSEDEQRSNRRVLRSIANALTKYPDYRITIEGHANPLSAAGTPEWTRQETTLRPLSEARARAVGEYLITNHNIVRTRFSYTGMGTSKPVADFNDDEEQWKNRRVEFILVK
ncbi:MAG: OmpA family protein [Treponema sp.]|nr:OmpA family protein [Treponema sp.]MCL2250514.1 OmpA family protein [Treponema sp.]